MIYFIRYIGFVLCSVILVLFFFPLCIVRPFNTKNSYILFTSFRKVCSRLLAIDLHIDGYEKLEKNRPGVIIANHQHTYDILVLGSFYTPFMTVLGKFELVFIPILGQFYALSGNMLIKRKNRKKAMQSMSEVEKKLKQKRLSVLIFPEGHRNPLPQITKFKKGAFYTAIRTSFPILPIAISQYRHLENFNRFKRVNIYIEVLDSIETKGLSETDLPALLEKSRRLIIEATDRLNKNHKISK